jgi:hypothetical protein
LAHAGIPVFKAISYFGTAILSAPRPTALSELVGWGFHFSNGVGFAVMYALLVRRPRWWTAVGWGVLLEAMMLATPYAEVFGYRRSWSFVATSLGAHVVYGLGLWLGLLRCPALVDAPDAVASARAPWRGRALAAWLAAPAVIGVIAVDFHSLHAASIPASPPPYLGPGLLVTWHTPEPDRIGAIWLTSRFIDSAARFHFVEPMSRIPYGTPFDVPEADIRRSTTRSTFEVLLDRSGKSSDPALRRLARFCHATEVQPWRIDPGGEDGELARALTARLGECPALGACLDRGLAWFDETYARLSRSSVVGLPEEGSRSRGSEERGGQPGP